MNTGDGNSNKSEAELILEIRQLAGKLGGKSNELENVADAENYDFQVQTGLAEAVVEILNHDPHEATTWFGHCLIHCGVKMNDRMKCLFDSIQREINDASSRDDAEDY